MTSTDTIATPNVHRIVIHPTDRVGSYRVTDRETGQEWTPKTRTPACATARILKACGAQPSDRLEMFRDGRERPDLTGTIGFFAARTVQENEKVGPRFVPHHEFDRSRVAAEAS